MIKKKTWMTPCDRCGVWGIRVFHLYKGFSRKTGFTGDFFKASVRYIKPDSWIKKKTKVHGIIVRANKEVYRHDGTSIKFNINSSVLLKKRMTPRGSELYGPITKIIKRKKFIRSFAGLM
jgi:large subunit ribosomal protein L14